MTSPLRAGLLAAYRALYECVSRPLIFRGDAQTAHERALRLMRYLDASPLAYSLLRALHRLSFERHPVTVGGVTLPHPLMLAAGWVKGDGFESEDDALAAVQRGRNVIPGWRSMPALVGVVEYGSFTRWPRIGNAGRVLWRDAATRSTQNRIGLKNPGAEAAAEFLAVRSADLPAVYGINLAPSPGVTDPDRETGEALEAVAAFTRRGVIPAWFTLNLSCPNTEDDPTGRQTGDRARELCGVIVAALRASGHDVPLWVKLSPGLGVDQYRALMCAFHEVGVRAVIATNTLAEPAPEDASLIAGVGGGRLHQKAVEAACWLVEEQRRLGARVDVIGCGGIDSGRAYADFARIGVQAAQYLSALVYRGPLAAAVIAQEFSIISHSHKADDNGSTTFLANR